VSAGGIISKRTKDQPGAKAFRAEVRHEAN